MQKKYRKSTEKVQKNGENVHKNAEKVQKNAENVQKNAENVQIMNPVGSTKWALKSMKVDYETYQINEKSCNEHNNQVICQRCTIDIENSPETFASALVNRTKQSTRVSEIKKEKQKTIPQNRPGVICTWAVRGLRSHPLGN